MNLKHVSLVLLSLVALLFSSCNNDTNTTTVLSGDAQISSFALAGTHDVNTADLTASLNDSLMVNQLNRTNFSIDQINNIIYNSDSLNCGAILKKFAATIHYSGSPTSVQISAADSLYTWNSSDSIDFAKQPVQIIVTPPNGKAKTYKIDIRIHKIDPDSLVWKQSTPLPLAGSQKTVLKGSVFYSYSVSSGRVLLYTATDTSGALTWTSQSVSGLPANVNLESITIFHNLFVAVTANGDSYNSTDGKNWTQQANAASVLAIYGVVPGVTSSQDVLLVCVQNGGVYNLATTTDLSSITATGMTLPSTFPISGFGTTTNYSPADNDNMLLLATGVSPTGQALVSTWLVRSTVSGLQLSPSRGYNNFAGAGNSIFVYSNLVYALSGSQLYTSVSWGYAWASAPAKQKMPISFIQRSGQSVIVDQNHIIWIFGGISGSGIYLKEVWRGKPNSYPLN